MDNLYEDVGNSSTAATTSQPVAPMPVTKPVGDGECLVSKLIVGLMGKVAPSAIRLQKVSKRKIVSYEMREKRSALLT